MATPAATPTQRPRQAGEPRAGGARAPAWLPLALAAVTLLVLAASAPRELFRGHTAFNHHALQAESWLSGRLDLGGEPPAYTQLNDFALYRDRWYVSFPPLPALLLLPLVALCGSAERTPDGLFFLLVAAAAPALLFRALEALRDAGASARGWRENAIIAGLLPCATVFWFTAVQGTVWFASHVVGVALASGFLWAAAGARRPALAGALLICAFATRPPLALAGVLFLTELWRVQAKGEVDLRALGLSVARFAAPIGLGLLLICALNQARFDDPFEMGHRHLQVVWRARMEKWGLFSLHYLGKNLGVALASTPFVGDKAGHVQITAHGLALWITSPFLALAAWPRALPLRQRRAYAGLALTAALVALPNLLYHNTGWVQFGYRFSNDYIVFLLAMLAVGRRPLRATFVALVSWSVFINAFGALSFQRPGWEKYYRYDVRPNVYFEPD